MRTKFNNYTKELDEIVNILRQFPSMLQISSKELQKYRGLISRREVLQKKINQMLNKRALIIGKYNDKNRTWLNSNMNCRKYCRLERKAAYLRDCSLHKLGFIREKPIHPVLHDTSNFIHERFFQPIDRIFKKIYKKIKSYFKSVTNKSPICKSFKKRKKFIKRDLTFTTPVRTISNIVEKARNETVLEKNTFISRIRINPQTHDYSSEIARLSDYYGNGRIITHSTSNPNNSNTLHHLNQSQKNNFDLAL